MWPACAGRPSQGRAAADAGPAARAGAALIKYGQIRQRNAVLAQRWRWRICMCAPGMCQGTPGRRRNGLYSNCNLQIRSKFSAVQISLLLPDWPGSRVRGRRPGPAVSGVVTSAVSKSVRKISEFDASPVRVRPAALTGCRTDMLDRRLGRSAWEAYAERASGRRR
jgi:hypothetical protein